jgi:polyferredoxin
MRDTAFMRDISKNRSVRAGFRRLWLVVSIIWLVGLGFSIFDHHNAAQIFLISGLLPVVGFYALFAGIAWIVEGFRS